MKSILMSIHPKWCELIASGKQTIAVRKTRPKIDTPFKVYIYCTKPKTIHDYFWSGIYSTKVGVLSATTNGKVIGEYICDEIYDIGYSPYNHGGFISNTDNLYRKSCLNLEEMFNYLSQGYGYAWHISDLKIYDELKNLSEFHKPCINPGSKICELCEFADFENGDVLFPRCINVLTRPPQSYCYVEELKENE